MMKHFVSNEKVKVKRRKLSYTFLFLLEILEGLIFINQLALEKPNGPQFPV